jgi:hypothetical protein
MLLNGIIYPMMRRLFLRFGTPRRTYAMMRWYRMRSSWRNMGWLAIVLLTSCIASHTAGPPSETERPAVDRLLNRGDIQVAEAHLQDFGFDPGPVDGIYTAQTKVAVRAYQARYGLPVSGLLDYTTRLQLIPGLDYDKDEP